MRCDNLSHQNRGIAPPSQAESKNPSPERRKLKNCLPWACQGPLPGSLQTAVARPPIRAEKRPKAGGGAEGGRRCLPSEPAALIHSAPSASERSPVPSPRALPPSMYPSPHVVSSPHPELLRSFPCILIPAFRFRSCPIFFLVPSAVGNFIFILPPFFVSTGGRSITSWFF